MFDLSNWKIKAVVAIVALAALLFCVWRVYDIGYNRGENARQALWSKAETDRTIAIENQRISEQTISDAIDRADMLRLEAEKERADNLQEKLNAERRKNRAYRDCIVPDDGVRIYTDAVRPARANQGASGR